MTLEMPSAPPRAARLYTEGVTVVMPAYNEEENLRATVEDFLGTLAGMEHRIVVVNDGSPDGTGRVLDELAELYPGRVIAVHHQVNQGYGGAVRTGIAAALDQTDMRRILLDRLRRSVQGRGPADLPPGAARRARRRGDRLPQAPRRPVHAQGQRLDLDPDEPGAAAHPQPGRRLRLQAARPQAPGPPDADRRSRRDLAGAARQDRRGLHAHRRTPGQPLSAPARPPDRRVAPGHPAVAHQPRQRLP